MYAVHILCRALLIYNVYTVFDLGVVDEDGDEDEDEEDDRPIPMPKPKPKPKIRPKPNHRLVSPPPLPFPLKIRFEIMVGGASKILAMTDQYTWGGFNDEVADVLRMSTANLRLVYEVPWKVSGSKQPARHLDSREALEALFEDVRNYVLREKQKKKNNGIVPPFSIIIKDVGNNQHELVRVLSLSCEAFV